VAGGNGSRGVSYEVRNLPEADRCRSRPFVGLIKHKDVAVYIPKMEYRCACTSVHRGPAVVLAAR